MVRGLAVIFVLTLGVLWLWSSPPVPDPREGWRHGLAERETMEARTAESQAVSLEAASRATATRARLVTVAAPIPPAREHLVLRDLAPLPDPPVVEPAAPPPPPRAPRPTAAAPQPTLLPPPPGVEPAWLRRAAALVARDGRPAVAIVMDDLGLNPRGTERIAALPGPLTMAFLPYGRELAAQSRLVREAGHEVLAHIPMEPVGSEYPGPNALLTRLDPGENLERLRAGLDRIEGLVGVNNHMGSRFTADRLALSPVMAELRARGLLFLDSRTSPETVGMAEALRHGVPAVSRHVFLDNVQETGAIRERLAELERVARAHGAAIAIGHPHIATIEALEAWLPTLEDRGLVLVPVSTLVAERACRDGLVVACRALAAAETRQLAAREGDER